MSSNGLQLLLHMDRLFATGDLEGWVRCIDDDVVYRNFNEGPARGEWVGKDAALGVFLAGVGGAYGDVAYELEVTAYRAVADDLAAMDWTVTLTPQGAERSSTSGCALFRIRDGRVVEIFEIAERQASDLVQHMAWQPTHVPLTRFAPPV